MTVEFLNADDPSGAASFERPEDRRAQRVRGADVVLSLGGAALLVLACFQDIFSIRGALGPDLNGGTLRVTGWGRTVIGEGLTQQAPRVGILLCVVAGLAALGLAARLRHGRRLGTALGFTAFGVAAATAGHSLLDALATETNFRESSDEVGRGDPAVSLGGFVWLGAAGAVCVLLALVIPSLTRPREPKPAAPPVEPPVIDEGEQLG